MKNISIMILFALAFLPAVSASVTVDLPGSGIYYKFDKPQGSGVTFEEELNAKIYYYEEPGILTVSDFSASVSGLTGLEVEVENSDFGIAPNSSLDIGVKFTVPASLKEGKYPVTVKLTGGGIPTKEKNITIEVEYPPATLEASWDTPDWKELTANTTFTRTLKILEVMGYQDAEDVSLHIDSSGPIGLEYSGGIGNITAATLKSVEVKVTVPARGLIPGDYDVVPFITTGAITDIIYENASYTIPFPNLAIESSPIDFGEITFETGKDFSQKNLIIKEQDGFTPIENLNVTLVRGDEGWVSFTSVDYIPAGGSENVLFTVYLPQDASLGRREWTYIIESPYTPERSLDAYVQVYFPGIDEATDYLEGRNPIQTYPDTGTLIGETLDLLEVGRGKTEIKKIAMVMSIYGGSRSFLNLLEDGFKAIENGELARGADMVISAHDSLNKIKIGNSNIYDADLKIYSSSIESISQDVWRDAANDVLSILEKNAGEAEGTDYRSAALYYERMSRLHDLLGNPDLAREYEEKRLTMEDRYTDTMEEASALKIEADQKVASADSQMYSFQDVYVIINPFNYESVSRSYSEAIEGYKDASQRYDVAGEDRDAQASRDHATELEGRMETTFRLFVVYGIFWTIVFIWLVSRISLGLQRFRQDEMDGLVGDVVVRKGKLEEAKT